MKLSPRAYVLSWEIHAWAGVCSSLVLFVAFYCGAFALFHPELEAWQEVVASREDAPHFSFDELLQLLEQESPFPAAASVALRQPSSSPLMQLSLYGRDEHSSRNVTIVRAVGTPRATRSRLADELYSMHFLYRIPYGLELTGVAALVLLLVLATGLLIHWKDLVRALWQFRPRLRLRYAASDAHKVLGVFGLPFALAYALSGALLGLPISALVTELFVSEQPAEANAAGIPMPHLRLSKLAELGEAAANAHYQRDVGQTQRMYIDLLGDANAHVSLDFDRAEFGPECSVRLSATTGAILDFGDDPRNRQNLFERVLFDLHYARFGGHLVNFTYALLTLLGCAVIFTGNVVWLERRDRERKHFGNRLLERLNVGVCLGLMTGSAFYFGANRALPTLFSSRAETEFCLFIAVWLSCLLATAVPRWNVARLAWAYCAISASVYAGVALTDLLDPRIRAALLHSLHDGRILRAEFLLVVLAAAAAWLARVYLNAARSAR